MSNQQVLPPQRDNHVSLGGDVAVQQQGMMSVEEARAIQEVRAAILVAKQFPRDTKAALDAILEACKRPSLADAGLYEYARGGSEIEGASIRLAEAIAQNWCNFEFTWRVLSTTGITSKVQAFAHDIQTNVKKSVIWDVKHWRDTKKGGYAVKDERDVYELIANSASRRMRNCILSLIPGDIVESARAQCEKTIAQEVTPEKMQKLLEAYANMGVNQAMIEARIQKKFEAIGGRQVVELRRVYNSIRDAMSKISDWFDVSLATVSKEKEPENPLDKFKSKDAPESHPGSPMTACKRCEGKGSVEWSNPDTGEVGTEPCPECAPYANAKAREEGRLV